MLLLLQCYFQFPCAIVPALLTQWKLLSTWLSIWKGFAKKYNWKTCHVGCPRNYYSSSDAARDSRIKFRWPGAAACMLIRGSTFFFSSPMHYYFALAFNTRLNSLGHNWFFAYCLILLPPLPPLLTINKKKSGGANRSAKNKAPRPEWKQRGARKRNTNPQRMLYY